jgi:hypothetical protein
MKPVNNLAVYTSLLSLVLPGELVAKVTPQGYKVGRSRCKIAGPRARANV